MGYDTFFKGKFELNRPATSEEIKYINNLSSTRRMKRDSEKLMEMYKGQFGFPNINSDNPIDIYGIEGEFFVKEGEINGDRNDISIIDHNSPSIKQPSLWCQWVLSDDGTNLAWDENEKFYNYVEWLDYIINIFNKWNIIINGEVSFQGQERRDKGKIKVKNNIIKLSK